MRQRALFLIVPAVLALAACGQSRKDVADDAARTSSTDGAMATNGAMTTDGSMTTDGAMSPDGTAMPGTSGMVPAPGDAVPSTDPMANPGIPGADLNTGPGNSNTGPGNDGSAGTTPSGINETPPVK